MSEIVNVEESIKKTGSKYVLASIISARAKQLNRGSKILVEDVSGKPIAIAFREFSEGKIKYTLPQDEAGFEENDLVIPELPDAAPEGEEIPVEIGSLEEDDEPAPRFSEGDEESGEENEEDASGEGEVDSERNEISLEEIEE